jgi:AraC family transcriptional regulator
MSTPSDTFAMFVDSVAASLDDHEVSGRQLAAQAFLSRFHFDRVVSAASGETPGRFRRRILLERAAYRLLSTGEGVLDVALEAGYSSNEAFTRAFARAYGVQPSLWRAKSTRPVWLETPNGVHFHPPGGLRLPAHSEVTDMDLLQKMVEHHVWLVGELVDRAARLPEQRLDEPVRVSVDNEDGRMTLRTLLSRLIGQMDMWNCAIETRDYDWSVEEHESVDHMRQRLSVVGPRFLDQVGTFVADRRLDETFVDALCEPPEVFTYGGMIAHVLTFAAYHRTLAVQALDMAGVKDLGWGDPMKWVA